jgi:hypothetical protein
MSTTVRTIIGLLCVVALAMLASPELSSKMPQYVSQALALGLAALLKQMNAKAPEAVEAPAEEPKKDEPA